VYEGSPSFSLSGADDHRTYFVDQQCWYSVRYVTNDTVRMQEYQRLRADFFVKQFGWNLPLDAEGRERDQHDAKNDGTVSIYGVYGACFTSPGEYLLAGLRIFHLRSWEDSMLMQEFHTAGMIPSSVLHTLKEQYEVTKVLELSRMCVQRGRRYIPIQFADHGFPGFDTASARDLVYACAYAIAEKEKRQMAVGIVHPLYLKAMQREQFTIKVLYSHQLHSRFQGYALVLVNLAQTIRSVRAAGAHAKAARMLALCQDKHWIDHCIEESQW